MPVCRGNGRKQVVSEVQFEGRFEQLRPVRASQSCELSRCWQYWQSYGQRDRHGFVTSSHCARLNNRKKGGNRCKKVLQRPFARRLRGVYAVNGRGPGGDGGKIACSITFGANLRSYKCKRITLRALVCFRLSWPQGKKGASVLMSKQLRSEQRC